MKKIYILVLLFSVGIVSYGQSGSGTSGDPYYGTISSSVSWNSSEATTTIYIGQSGGNEDLTIDDGGHLTIGANTTIVFTQTTSDLIITGTGRITADASLSNEITFTKASGNDHWGHISFQNMGSASSSIFDHCKIEYGNVDGNSTDNPDRYGGGIHIDFSDVTISNCEISNNTAGWGGGIFVNKTHNPTIDNCIISNNTAITGGGGIYCWEEVNSVIRNCIINNNEATGSGGGGGIFLGNNTYDVVVVNSTIISNDATNNIGNDIRFYDNDNSLRPSFRNCIVWGNSSSSISYFSQPVSSSDFINCAIEGSYSSTYTNCFDLNSSNSASDGPNFTDPASDDWSIAFISPCRDAGSDTDAPSSDYDGEPRIHTADIGAYEVQYSRWTGASGTGWSTSGNWEDGVTPPTGTGDVIIPKVATNYPDVSSTVTVNTDKYLIIEPGAQLTAGTLSNSGNVIFESDENDIYSVILTNSTAYSGSGDLTIELFLKGGTSPGNMWHYIAAPNGTMNKSVITDIEPNNLLRYDDSRVSTSVNEGWHWHDGWDGSKEVPADSWPTLEFARGYNFYHSTDITIEYPADALSRNLGEVTLQNSSGGSDPNSLYGLNLLGNSLSCSIDWDEVTFSDGENVRNAIYMTTENTIASYVNEVSTNGGSNIIPPLQGFFVRTINNGESIDFTGANVNVHGTQARYKGKSIIPLVRLEAVNAAGNTDEMVVRFDYNASDEFDSKYDASKILSKSLVYPQIYSYIGNEKYSINGINFPDAEKEISLGFKAMEQGNYTISATEIQGVENYDIYLTDTYQNNYTVDLKAVPDYNFTSDKGTFDDRFLITIGGMATGFDDIAEDNDFNMYTFSGQLNIQNMSDEWSGKATVNVYDLTGRLVSKHPEQEMYTGETIQLPFNNQQGIYIIEITNGTRRTVQKLSHR
ncbi:MAG: right-handed parallel beta-helix repeat-containing protein [Bacteroidales bacterium]|nr:right-handed parallel beta-helix repeat-containing protein [Bacteroidales bacterium]